MVAAVKDGIRERDGSLLYDDPQKLIARDYFGRQNAILTWRPLQPLGKLLEFQGLTMATN